MGFLRSIITAFLLLGIPAALAQSPGTVVLGTGPASNSPASVSGAVNSALTAKQDYLGTNGTGKILRETSPTINSPTINSPNLSGTIGGTFGGAFTGGTVDGSPIGSTTPSTGAFTNLSASGAVSGAGFTNRFAAPGPIGNTTPSTGAFTTLSTTGLTTFGGPVASQSGTSITASGAKCDGVTDDTAVLNTWLATLTNGGLVVIPANTMCLINSGNLLLKPDTRIIGASDSYQAGGAATVKASGFYLNPAYTIMVNSPGSYTLQNIAIVRAGEVQNPTQAQAIAEVAKWGTEQSVGVTNYNGRLTLEHVYIEGFNMGVYSWSQIVNMNDVGIDCYNGIYLTQVGSNQYYNDVKLLPYWTIRNGVTSGAQPAITVAQSAPGTSLQFAANSLTNVGVGTYAAVLLGGRVNAIPYGTTVTAVNNAAGTVTLSAATTAALQVGDIAAFGGAWARPGTGFYFQGGTGWYCTRCHTFTWRQGFVIDAVGVGEMDEGGFEYQHFIDPQTDGKGTIGVRLTGHAAGVTINNSSAGGFGTSFSMEGQSAGGTLTGIGLGSPDFISIGGGGTGPGAVAGMYVSGASGASQIVTITGTASAGAKLSLTINGTTVTYTVPSGINLLQQQFIEQVIRLINTSQPLAFLNVSAAQLTNTSFSVIAPAATTLTVSVASTAVITAAVTTGATSAGSWGAMDFFAMAGSTVPAIIVAPGKTLPWLIGNPYGSNTGGLVPGTIQIDPTSANQIILRGWVAPVIVGGSVSGCGTSSTTTSGSTDLRGSITEGTTSTGCTITFRSGFPRAPFCTVSPMNGGPVPSTVTVSATAVAWTHPSGSNYQYTWACDP